MNLKLIVAFVDDDRTDVRSIGRMATMEDAIAAMREAGVSSLVVERRNGVDEYGLAGTACV